MNESIETGRCQHVTRLDLESLGPDRLYILYMLKNFPETAFINVNTPTTSLKLDKITR